MGNCIGRRNYPFFFGFLISCLLNLLVVFGVSVYYLVQVGQLIGICLGISIFTCILIWPLAGLFVYHSYLISINVTTHEDLRSTTLQNPYDEGSVFKNCVSMLFTPCFPNQQLHLTELEI
jgi:palmitoyltransferase ZDHHC9/14/18